MTIKDIGILPDTTQTGYMKFLSVIITLLLFSCHQQERSAIQIIKLDRNKIQHIINTSDKPIIDTPRRNDFYFIEHYTNKNDSSLTKILKDSLHNIIGITQTKNGTCTFSAEYYPNGQIKGVLTLNKNGEPEGPAKYFYADGRIRSSGNWKNDSQDGKWMEYDKDGNLIVEHDQNPN